MLINYTTSSDSFVCLFILLPERVHPDGEVVTLGSRCLFTEWWCWVMWHLLAVKPSLQVTLPNEIAPPFYINQSNQRSSEFQRLKYPIDLLKWPKKTMKELNMGYFRVPAANISRIRCARVPYNVSYTDMLMHIEKSAVDWWVMRLADCWWNGDGLSYHHM